MKAKIYSLFLLLMVTPLTFAGVYKSNAEASYYAEKYHGRKTASGETFNMYAMTCAHKTLPFGTLLRITNLSNNKSVDVRVNDRGPFVKGREVDLSKVAAQKLDMLRTGTARVKIEIIDDNMGGKKTGKTPAETSKSYWNIQIGSYSNQENANKVAQALLREGFENVFFQKTSKVTRVVLKKVPDSELSFIKVKLQQNGHSAFLVKKDS